MSLKYFTRRTAIDATTTSPYLTNLNHLLPIPKAWLKRRSIYDPKLKSVRTRDRIRYWNIVPGDQIRIRGDKTNALHEVLSINRLSNRVFVKGGANVRSVPYFLCFVAEHAYSRVETKRRFRKPKTFTILGASCLLATTSSLRQMGWGRMLSRVLICLLFLRIFD